MIRTTILCTILATGTGNALDTSPRPQARPDVVRAAAVPDLPDLNNWTRAFRPRALAAGIDAATFDAAVASVRVVPDVVRRDRNQSEFTKTLWDYLDSAVSDLRVSNGRKALARHHDALQAIEAAHGVPAEVVVAVWGLESAYGTFRGDTHTLSALATLAAEGRRARFFEAQLIAALRILQAGDVTPAAMRGSWAGAMGHTQFMPTSYLDHAVDHDGDGRRDIWADDPVDALASTAAYLSNFGWRTDEPWGMEVQLPDGFDYALTGEVTVRPASFWTERGVRRADGSPLPANNRVSILVPAGAKGAAIARYPNFAVIERYNPADAYVIGVGHLSDRIAGGPGWQAGWPRGDRALTGAERREVQRRLRGAGFDPGGVDGKVGPLTLDAVRRWQAARGLTPDGYAGPGLLDRLRAATGS
ncbi:lytic murein transglycosylase [Jannaschia sp. LMIT008]|uniref:lytic murein transglycosylase n=1 Tax=Jannaschia maritima TaxID=3032585 RepID=UPI002811C131|nr:lytic murein transglycosylase [Jannaschia sp. LMIT008]